MSVVQEVSSSQIISPRGSPDFDSLPANIKQFAFNNILTGVPTQLVAAPAAGYVRVVNLLRVTNNDVAIAAGFQITDSLGLVGGVAATILGNSGLTTIATTLPAYLTTTTGPLSITITGVGAHLAVSGYYWDLPTPPGFVSIALALTNAFQSIATIIPAVAGVVSIPVLANKIGLIQNFYTVSVDTTARTPVTRTTRSAVQYDGIYLASSGSLRTAQSYPIPLILGDTFEAKLLTGPTTPGQIYLRGAFQTFPS